MLLDKGALQDYDGTLTNSHNLEAPKRNFQLQSRWKLLLDKGALQDYDGTLTNSHNLEAPKRNFQLQSRWKLLLDKRRCKIMTEL